MAKQFRKLDQLMLSLGDMEATYDAGPGAWVAASAVQLYEFGDAYAAWDDVIITDRDVIHGSQFATITEITGQDLRLAYAEPRVRPTNLAGFAALVGGVVASTKDGTFAAWRHKCTPVGAAVALPSIGAIEKSSGEQYKYTGVCADTFKITRGGPNNRYFALDVGLVGSGTRVTDATAFVAKVAENPFSWGKVKCFLEAAPNIAVRATPAQGSINISAGAGTELTARLLSFEFSHNNALDVQDGYYPGTGLVRGRLDHGEGRTAHIKVTLIVNPATLATERGYFTAQTGLALELNLDSGVLVAAGGTFKFGFDLIVPLLHLAPITRGVQTDWATITLEGDCMDDGTNPLWIFYVWNGYTAYLV